MAIKIRLGRLSFGETMPVTIIGVLKDFHFNSLHLAIEPLILHLGENWTLGTILIRTQAGKTKEALAGLQKMYTIHSTRNFHLPISFLTKNLHVYIRVKRW